MTTSILPILHIEQKPNSHKARIVGKGVTVQFLASFINHPEWSVERICDEFSLTPAQVHAAWSYYYDHQAEIDAAMQADREETARILADETYQAKIAHLKHKATMR